jgi:hypothetical protein
MALGLLAALMAAGLLWLRRRRPARVRRPPTPAGGSPAADSSPRDRLVALSESIRDALILQFGAGCRAKTTEELAIDARLEQLLGPEDFRDLIRFLDQIDRVKFAPERSGNPPETLPEVLATWEPRVAILGGRIRAGPRARPQARDGTPDRSGAEPPGRRRAGRA